MIRRMLSVVAIVVTGLFLLAGAGIASAQDYVPGAVTSSSGTGGSGAAVGQSVAGSLSYTGAGFSVAGAVAIGALVLVLGIGLVVVGSRMTRLRSSGS